jgi:hypothetical protein
VQACVFYFKNHNLKSHQETSLMIEKAIEIAKNENEDVQRFILGLYDLHISFEDCFKDK